MYERLYNKVLSSAHRRRRSRSRPASSARPVRTRAHCHSLLLFVTLIGILHINENEGGIMTEGPRLSRPWFSPTRRARPCVLLGRPPEAGANDTLHFRQELTGAVGIANCKYWCELVRNRASLWHLLAHAGPSKPTEPRVEGFSLLVSCGTNCSNMCNTTNERTGHGQGKAALAPVRGSVLLFRTLGFARGGPLLHHKD